MIEAGENVMDEFSLYNIAYKYLLYSIHFGRYPAGSSLPTVPALCSAFRVSRTTIHSALKMLEEDGYVSLSQGRSAIVTYDVKGERCRGHYIAYSYEARDALMDLCESMRMIWPEIMTRGLELCGEEDLITLEQIRGRMTEQSEYPLYEFFYQILQTLGNPLLLNLYMSTVFFGHPNMMHLGDNGYKDGYMEYSASAVSQILAHRKAGEYKELKALLRRLYEKQIECIRMYHESLPTPQKPIKQIPYRWNYYTERPLAGFDLAMKLLRLIYASYNKKEYLPSYAALSKQYSAPVMTVRRAIKILCDIGIVETVAGKGTRVMVGSGTTVNISRLSTPNMKKVLLPYLQSVQIILLICKDVSLAAFPTIPDSAVQSAVIWLRNLLKSGDYSVTFGVCFGLLFKNTQYAALREILGGLMYFQYFGYPLKDLEPNGFRFNPRSTELLLKSLEEKDAALFAEELQRLMLDIFKAAREKLLMGEVWEAKSVVLPPPWQDPLDIMA